MQRKQINPIFLNVFFFLLSSLKQSKQVSTLSDVEFTAIIRYQNEFTEGADKRIAIQSRWSCV